MIPEKRNRCCEGCLCHVDPVTIKKILICKTKVTRNPGDVLLLRNILNLLQILHGVPNFTLGPIRNTNLPPSLRPLGGVAL